MQDKSAEATYLELVERANRGDLSLDFRALRLACAKARNCDSRGGNNDLAAMKAALDQSEYEQAIVLAEKLIKAGFANIEAHAACGRAYAALGNTDKAKFHQAVTSSLINSILSSGDGRTKETAFEVIGIPEEYTILSVLGYDRPSLQSLIREKPHSWDVLDVLNRNTGKKVRLYFNIDAFFPAN